MKENYYLVIVAVGIAAVAFLGVYIAKQGMLFPKEFEEVNGINVYGGGLTAIGNALTPAKLSVQVRVAEDKPIPCMSKTWIETASALGSAYKEVQNLVNINGEYCLGENQTRQPCPTANVLITEGSCNCIRAYPENKSVEIIGDDSFYCANETSVQIRQIFRAALGADQTIS